MVTLHSTLEYHSDDADYGCLVFASFAGGTSSHDWDNDPNE